jgi:hypothetical protein
MDKDTKQFLLLLSFWVIVLVLLMIGGSIDQSRAERRKLIEAGYIQRENGTWTKPTTNPEKP